jgi:MFS family permease
VPSASSEPPYSPRFAPVLYGAVALFFWASLYAYVPTLPNYARTFTDDLALIGLIIAMYGLWQAVVRLPLGITADWAGRRKPFIALGLALSAGGALIMGSAHTPAALLAGRSVTGLAAATWVPLTVVFSALYPPKEAIRATTALTLTSTVGRLAATAANGPLNAIGGYSLAFTAAAVTAGLGLLLLIPAPERRRPVRAPTTSGIWRLVTRSDVLGPALLNALVHYVVLGVSFGFLPLLARDLGASDQTISLMTVAHLAVITPAVLLLALLLKQYRVRTLVIASFVMLAAGAACAGLADSVPWLFASQMLVGIGYGIGYSILMGMSIEHVEDAERTTAMGLHQSVYAIGMFAGSWLSGILANSLGIRPMFVLTAAGALVFGVLGSVLATRQPRLPKPDFV